MKRTIASLLMVALFALGGGVAAARRAPPPKRSCELSKLSQDWSRVRRKAEVTLTNVLLYALTEHLGKRLPTWARRAIREEARREARHQVDTLRAKVRRACRSRGPFSPRLL